MDKYGWKDMYYDAYGAIVDKSTARFFSVLGRNNSNGTSNDPWNNSYMTQIGNNILGIGYFPQIATMPTNPPGFQFIVGHGINRTVIDVLNTSNQTSGRYMSICDATIQRVVGIGSVASYYKRCELKESAVSSWVAMGNATNKIKYNCIYHKAATWMYYIYQSTFVDPAGFALSPVLNYAYSQSSLFVRGSVIITQADMINISNTYMAFDRVAFRIGTETEATLLTGNTADELRQNFVDRCTAAGITNIPAYTEYGGANVPAGRWVFSNNSVAGDYDVIEGGEIDSFAKTRGIYFGYSNQTVKPIVIASDGTAAASFNADSPKESIAISDNNITLDADTTVRTEGYIDSNIIWLGGLRKLNMLNILHNLPVDSGVAVDSTFAFGHKLDKIDGVNESLNQPFDGITVAVPVQMSTTATPEAIVFCKGMFAGQNTFAAKVGDTYYNNWVGRDNYADGSGKPLTDRLFVHNDQKYYWDGSKMIEANTSIEPDTMYIVRSDDNNEATVTYKGTTYSSSLVTRNNVFMGVSGVESFTPSSNAVILPVRDVINYQTVQLRIVESIPSDKITSGSLSSGYWYFVAPNSIGDTSGTVTYNGKTYPCLSSFLATDTTTFTLKGACHLRRCWAQDFDFNAENIDEDFWKDKQKPYYFHLNPDDCRCMKANNSPAANEMRTDSDGNYIASGHPDFYSEFTGVNGIKSPAFDITGTFMQVRIPITTLNAM
ncbi:hypothetical protein M2132_000815 [Dysgonomonas sp. PH5-45]|uniref:hypothetical protein n=1 Tax=unclassified Dysgonomonas TaxID=2630389 RepID=UPI0024746A8A|nr:MULTISPECIES: hypothetical protein [unclassified Dysgonomonas]MDH6354487.1 hypothetical protein [Dysgonomonas sp. PH5-45]MDH6387456.1 hypothetical protein [Dysgonomonas sp. PH5-37]